MKKKIETMQLPPPIARKGKNARSSVPHLNKKREAKKQGHMENQQ